MSYLNYTIFYKAKFMISSTCDGADLLWDFVKCVRQWQTEKWNKDGKVVVDDRMAAWSRLKDGNRLFSANGSERPVYIEAEYFSPKNNPAQRFWACKISEKKAKASGYCERDWVTEIGFRQNDPTSAEFSCVISYGDTPEFIGRYEETPDPTLPGLIRILIRSKRLRCYSGVDEVTNWASELKVGDFPAFRNALVNPERTIPYIYISPRRKNADSDETELLLDPKKLSRVVCGNAKVFFSNSIAFTQEMSFMFNCKEYSCYGGSIRVYRPTLDDRDVNDAYRHRSLHPAFLEEVGEDEVLRIYRRALAQNVSFYENFFGVAQCQEMKREEARQLRIDELRSRHAKEIDELQGSMLDEAIEEEQKRLEAEQLASELLQQLGEANSKCYSYESKIEGMKATVARATALEAAVAARMNVSKYPQTPAAIVEFFSSFFTDRIAFTESATKSLKGCRLAPRDLWEILFNLSTVMWDLMQSDSCPDPYKEFHNCTGIDASRGEGRMTRKDSKLMDQFKTHYDGRVIDIEPHITYGRESQSVHFGFDTDTGKIIIGHCGQHLDIYSTQKRK